MRQHLVLEGTNSSVPLVNIYGRLSMFDAQGIQ